MTWLLPRSPHCGSASLAPSSRSAADVPGLNPRPGAAARQLQLVAQVSVLLVGERAVHVYDVTPVDAVGLGVRQGQAKRILIESNSGRTIADRDVLFDMK